MRFILDDTDYQILEILQQNARITMKELSKKICMSSPAVGERVRRLEEAGVITGYHAAINPEKLGLKTHGYIIVDVPPISLRQSFYDFVKSRKEFTKAEAIITSGKEMIISVFCRDATHLMELHKEIFHLASTTTHLCAAQVIKDEPLDPRLAQPESVGHED